MCNCEKCNVYSCGQEYYGDWYEECGFGAFYRGFSPFGKKHFICFMPNWIKKIVINRKYRREEKYYERLMKDEWKNEN